MTCKISNFAGGKNLDYLLQWFLNFRKSQNHLGEGRLAKMKKVKESKDMMMAFSQKRKFLDKLKILVSGSRVASSVI